MIARHPRGLGTKVSAGVARGGCNVVTQRIVPARSRGTDSSGSRGGAGATIEGKQKAFVPPPAGRAGRVLREVFRGKCRIPPAGFASRGRVASPRRETRRPHLGAPGALPPRFARLRGRGLPRFCRLRHVGPLRQASEHPAEYFEFRRLSYEPAGSTTSDTKIPRQPPGKGLPC